MCEQTTGLGDGAITSDTVLFAYFTNLINQAWRTAAFLAWSADKSWVFDDTNKTTFPSATTTIVEDQRDYGLATTDLRLRQVEIKQANGFYVTLQYMAENSGLLFTQKEQEPKGLPTHYRLVGGSIILYPVPDLTVVTAAAGIRITTDREVDSFAVSDTDKEPGMPELMHPILYYSPCKEWARKTNKPEIVKLCQEFLGEVPGLTGVLGQFFGDRNQTSRLRIARSYKSFK